MSHYNTLYTDECGCKVVQGYHCNCPEAEFETWKIECKKHEIESNKRREAKWLHEDIIQQSKKDDELIQSEMQ